MIVPGAMMIEPTESESREELDLLIDALKQIAQEAAENPELVRDGAALDAPAAAGRDGAARKPVLRWKGPAEEACAVTADAAAKEW